MIYNIFIAKSQSSRKHGYISRPAQLKAIPLIPHSTIVERGTFTFSIYIPNNPKEIKEAEEFIKKNFYEWYKHTDDKGQTK